VLEARLDGIDPRLRHPSEGLEHQGGDVLGVDRPESRIPPRGAHAHAQGGPGLPQRDPRLSHEHDLVAVDAAQARAEGGRAEQQVAEQVHGVGMDALAGMQPDAGIPRGVAGRGPDPLEAVLRDARLGVGELRRLDSGTAQDRPPVGAERLERFHEEAQRGRGRRRRVGHRSRKRNREARASGWRPGSRIWRARSTAPAFARGPSELTWALAHPNR
jgi:hypothetical protein